MSQTLYRELHPPTIVTHCVEAYFTQAAGRQNGTTPPNLVIARGTKIEVHALNYGSRGPPDPGSSAGIPHSAVARCRLELVGSWQCWGVVQDMAVLRGRGNNGQRDSIVVAFRDAKVAVVEWDDQLHCLRTGSLHSFEGDPALREGCPCGSAGLVLAPPPRVAADPLGRCAAALVYGKYLAILPAIQADLLETLLQEGAAAKGSRTSASVGNSYLVQLAKMPTIKLASDTAVRGMTFLHGYTEPVLLLLHESAPTWGGRLRDVRDTCCLSAMSVNIRKKRQPVIWSVQHLPSDCSRVMAVPRGGVLVLSQNLLLYYAQGGSCVMAINSNAFAGEVPPRLDVAGPPPPQFPPRSQAEQQAAAAAAAEKAVTAATAYAKQWAANVHPETVAAAAKGVPKAPGMELEADGAVGCWLAGHIALLSLKTGQLLLVALKFEAAAASKMQVLVAGSAPVASCAVALTSNLLFLGSCVGDSLLVRYGPELPTAGSAAALASGGTERPSNGTGGVEHPAKRRRLSSLASFEMGGGVEGDMELDRRCAAATDGIDLDDDADVHKSAVGRSHSAVMPVLLVDGVKHHFKVLDSLLCIGPIRSTDIASLHLRESDVHASLSGESPQHEPSQCVIAAVGSDKSGALAIMRRGVVADVITAVPGLEAHGAWTLHYREPKGLNPDSNVVQHSESSGGHDGLSSSGYSAGDEEGPLDVSERYHAFLLLSCRGDSTMVLDARGQELAEITEQVAYIRDAPTIAVGELFNATAAVQVTHSTVRVVRGSSYCLQDIPLAELLADANHPAAADDKDTKMCIKYAQVRDPYVVLLLSDHYGTVLLLQGDVQQQRLVLVKAALQGLAERSWQDSIAAITAVCLYTDTTGWLTAATGCKVADVQQQNVTNGAEPSGLPDDQDAARDGAGDDQHQQNGGVSVDSQQPAVVDDEDVLMAEAAAEAPAAGESPATAAAAETHDVHQKQQEQQQQEQKAPMLAEGTATTPTQDSKLFIVPESDAAAAAGGVDGAAATGVLEGVEGVDAGMAEAATGPDQQQGDVAAADPAADLSAPEVAAEGEAASPQQQNQQEQQRADEPAIAGIAASQPDRAAAAADTLPVQQQREGKAPIESMPKLPSMSFCCTVRADGSLQLYALPSMACVFQEAEASLGHQAMTPARADSPYVENVADDDLQPSTINEVIMECFAGSSGAALGVPAAAAPLLVLLRDNGQCLVYKAYKAANPRSTLGFRRQPLDAPLLSHPSPAPPPAATATAAPAPGMPLPSAAPYRLSRFDHLVTPRLEQPLGPGALAAGLNSSASGSATGDTSQGPKLRYSGIFLCGPKPVWLIASRGGLVPHHMDGKALVHYPEARLIALTTSRLSTPPRPFLPADPGGDAVAAAAYATAEAAAKAAGVEELNELQLLAPPGCGLPISSYTSAAAAIHAAAAAAGAGGSSISSSQGLLSAPALGAGTAGAAAGSSAKIAAAVAAAAGWVGLPMFRYSLLPGEQALCLKSVALCEGGDETANPEPFIAVGCASAFGEDYPALGRVLLFQVMKDTIFRIEGGSEAKIHARLALQREYPGPVTALEGLRGFLLMGVGNRVEMHYKQGNTLVKVTFFDGLQLVTGMRLVKDYILVGQVAQSCAFMRYSNKLDQHIRERQQTLEMLGHDMERLDATAVEFMANGKILSQVLADGGGNITVLAYDKTDINSWGGKKLMRRGAAHLGCQITALERLRMAVPGDTSNRQALLAATSDGGLLLLSPFWDESLYKRMAGLHEELVYQLQHTAGLNPKAFQARYCRAGPAYGASYNIMKPLSPEHNAMLQGDLMWAYASMDVRAQTAIAEAVGLEPNPDVLLEDLRALSVATDFL